LGNYIHDIDGGGCVQTGAILHNGNAGASQGGTINGNKIINVGPQNVLPWNNGTSTQPISDWGTTGLPSCRYQHGLYIGFSNTIVTNNIIGRVSYSGITFGKNPASANGCTGMVIANNT